MQSNYTKWVAQVESLNHLKKISRKNSKISNLNLNSHLQSNKSNNNKNNREKTVNRANKKKLSIDQGLEV